MEGCGRKEQARALAREGAKSFGELASYYDSLATQPRTYLSLYRYERATANEPVPDTITRLIDDQAKALSARATLARKVEGVYEALGRLVDYNAAEEVSRAVGGLRDEVEKHTKPLNQAVSIPLLSSAVKPADLLDKGAKALADLAQSRAFKKDLPNVLVLLDGFVSLYQGEEPVYLQIAERTDDEAYRVAKSLVEAGVTAPPSTLRSVVGLYGVELGDSPISNAAVTPKLKAFTLEQLEVRRNARMEDLKRTAEELADRLGTLQLAHYEFLHKPPPPSQSGRGDPLERSPGGAPSLDRRP